jgi:E3 ubiquitin-protein ligase synoviolin
LKFAKPFRYVSVHQRLYDRLWFFVTESLLAFTIFRDEFDIPFALMFGFLLFVKSFHWLASDRIEWVRSSLFAFALKFTPEGQMDQTPYPGPPTLFHVRMHTLFFILWATDLFMFALAVENTLTNGVGGMVLFASEVYISIYYSV